MHSPACPGEECALCHHNELGRFPDLKGEEKEILENPHVFGMPILIYLSIYLNLDVLLCWEEGQVVAVADVQDLNLSYFYSARFFAKKVLC